MNIGIDAKRFFFNTSGLGAYSRGFYKALVSKATDDRFYLYSKKVRENNPYLHSGEIKWENTKCVSPQNFYEKLFGAALWRSYFINNQLNKDKIDIYYGLSNEIPYGIQKTKTKSVAVIHDLIFLRYPNLYPKTDVFFYKRKTDFACKNADYIVAVSEQTKADIIHFLNVKPEKITILPPICKEMYAQNASSSAKNPTEFHFKKDYILSVGAITPRKNLLKTVQAFQLIHQKLEVDLVIVGTAVGLGRNYLAEIQAFIAKHHLTDKIHFLGNVSDAQLPSLYQNAKMLVYPSQYEGFGMPIVESLFSKTPVITSLGSCFDGTAGGGALYVNPNEITEIADSIEKLLINNALRENLIIAGFQHVQQFSAENIANEIFRFHSSIKS